MGARANPRRHPHLARTIAYLRHCGADSIDIVHRKRVVLISWDHEGRRLSVELRRSGKPDLHVAVALQKVRQRYRQAGVEVRA